MTMPCALIAPQKQARRAHEGESARSRILFRGGHGHRGPRGFDRARGLSGEFGGVLPKEGVAVLESQLDAPEGVVVAETEGVAEAVRRSRSSSER